MSVESLKSFFKHISTDAEAAAKVQELAADGADAVVGYASQMGFEITPDDIAEFEKQMEAARESLAERSRSVLVKENAQESEGVKNLKQFILLSEENQEMKNKLAELGLENPQAIVDYGHELGLYFTQQDMDELGRQILEKSDELSDDELEKVAGGFCTTTLIIAVWMVGALGAGAVSVLGVAAVGIAAGALIGVSAGAVVGLAANIVTIK